MIEMIIDNKEVTPVNFRGSNLKVLEQREVLGQAFKIYGDKENPLFLAKDVKDWIEHNNITLMLNSVDKDEKLTYVIHNSGQKREMWFLTEDGLYEVLMQSRKPIAKVFKKEVKKILKQIRQTGGYIPIEENMTDEEIMARAFMIQKKTIEQKEQLLIETKEKLDYTTNKLEIKEEILTKFEKAEKLATVTDVAREISSLGIVIGGRTLYRELREWGLICKTSIDPTQKALEKGLFIIKTPVAQNGIQYRTTKVTGKGKHYIMQRILKENKEIGKQLSF